MITAGHVACRVRVVFQAMQTRVANAKPVGPPLLYVELFRPEARYLSKH